MSDRRFDTSKPLFKKSVTKQNKVKVDDRFKSVLKDERFLSTPGTIDKYGRKVKNSVKKQQKELSEFYDIDQDDDDNDVDDVENDDDLKVTDNKSKKPLAKKKPTKKDSDESRFDYLTKLARGEIEDENDSDSNSDDNSDDDDDSNVYGVDDNDDDDNNKRVKRSSAGPLDIGDHQQIDILEGDATHRLAIQNCDWDNLKAQDILAVLQSFCPLGKSVKSVTVYLSDYGRERLEDESRHGIRGIWSSTPSLSSSSSSSSAKKEQGKGKGAKVSSATLNNDDEEEEEDSDDDDSDDGNDNESADDAEEEDDNSDDDDIKKSATNKSSNNTVKTKKIKGDFIRPKGRVGIVMQNELMGDSDEDGDDNEIAEDDNNHKGKKSIEKGKKSSKKKTDGNDDGVDSVALRRYELNKLRYYFAVAVCDSASTAESLYTEVDGIEMEHSAMVFDLRFIPNDVEFKDRKIRDSCFSSSLSLETYQPPDFFVQALQHTKVECSWDTGERERERVLTNMSLWKQLNESDLRQYIANSDSGSDDDENENDNDDKDSEVNSDDVEEEEEEEQKHKIKNKRDADNHKLKPKSNKSKEKAARLRKLLLGVDDGSDDEDDTGVEGDDFFGGDDDDEAKDGDDDDNSAEEEEEENENYSKKASADNKKNSDKKNNKKSQENKNLADMEMTYTYVPETNGDDDTDNDDGAIDTSKKTPLEAAMLKLKTKKKARKALLKEKIKSALAEEKSTKKEKFKLQLQSKQQDKFATKRNDVEIGDYDMRSLVKEEKLKNKLKPGKKNKKLTKELNALSNIHESSGATNFTVNLSDDRFAALVQGDSRYGIDPTSTLFKQTSGMKSILEAQRKRRHDQEDGGDNNNNGNNATTSTSSKQKHSDNSSSASTSESQADSDGGSGLSSKDLVAKLKRKFADT